MLPRLLSLLCFLLLSEAALTQKVPETLVAGETKSCTLTIWNAVAISSRGWETQ